MTPGVLKGNKQGGKKGTEEEEEDRMVKKNLSHFSNVGCYVLAYSRSGGNAEENVSDGSAGLRVRFTGTLCFITHPVEMSGFLFPDI